MTYATKWKITTDNPEFFIGRDEVQKIINPSDKVGDWKFVSYVYEFIFLRARSVLGFWVGVYINLPTHHKKITTTNTQYFLFLKTYLIYNFKVSVK